MQQTDESNDHLIFQAAIWQQQISGILSLGFISDAVTSDRVASSLE